MLQLIGGNVFGFGLMVGHQQRLLPKEVGDRGMSTQIFLRNAGASTHRGNNEAKLDGDTIFGWRPKLLSTSRGSTNTASQAVPTVAGPTPGIEIVDASDGAAPTEWLSEPLNQDVTISGTITLNFWAFENSMSANVAINAFIQRVDSQGAIISTIAQTARTTELGTSATVQNFTVTPTSTNMLKGERIRLRVYGDDAGTMATGFTFTLQYDGPTGGANGDSFITFTETFGFLTSTPAGSQLFLTDVAGPAVGANIEKEMWLNRGDGVNSIIRNTAAGWLTPLQWTDSGGGTLVEWYSKRVNAFTLADLVQCNLRALQSNVAAEASIRAEIAVVDSDGSNPVIWGSSSPYETSFNGELITSETAHSFIVSGDDINVTAGQRIRLRVFIDDKSRAPPMASGHTATLFYDGTSGGASGDSWIQLTQTVTEYTPTLAFPQKSLKIVPLI